MPFDVTLPRTFPCSHSGKNAAPGRTEPGPRLHIAKFARLFAFVRRVIQRAIRATLTDSTVLDSSPLTYIVNPTHIGRKNAWQNKTHLTGVCTAALSAPCATAIRTVIRLRRATTPTTRRALRLRIPTLPASTRTANRFIGSTLGLRCIATDNVYRTCSTTHVLR